MVDSRKWQELSNKNMPSPRLMHTGDEHYAAFTGAFADMARGLHEALGDEHVQVIAEHIAVAANKLVDADHALLAMARAEKQMDRWIVAAMIPAPHIGGTGVFPLLTGLFETQAKEAATAFAHVIGHALRAAGAPPLGEVGAWLESDFSALAAKMVADGEADYLKHAQGEVH